MNMKRLASHVYFTICVSLFSCSSNEVTFPVEKRYWDPEDYKDVIWKIRSIPEEQGRPRFSDSETSMVVRKLTDHSNYEVVLTDPELGLNHKAEVAQLFFDQYRNIVDLYTAMDRQDMYLYPEELIEAQKFGLGLQLKYFKLGNERIIQQADNPDAENVQRTIRSNEDIILKNFNNYLDNINDEKSFGTYAPKLAEGINIYFIALIQTFPNADFKITLNKAELMLNKSQIQEVKASLKSLIEKINSLKNPEPVS